MKEKRSKKKRYSPASDKPLKHDASLEDLLNFWRKYLDTDHFQIFKIEVEKIFGNQKYKKKKIEPYILNKELISIYQLDREEQSEIHNRELKILDKILTLLGCPPKEDKNIEHFLNDSSKRLNPFVTVEEYQHLFVEAIPILEKARTALLKMMYGTSSNGHRPLNKLLNFAIIGLIRNLTETQIPHTNIDKKRLSNLIRLTCESIARILFAMDVSSVGSKGFSKLDKKKKQEAIDGITGQGLERRFKNISKKILFCLSMMDIGIPIFSVSKSLLKKPPYLSPNNSSS